jgi:hypothetical protein
MTRNSLSIAILLGCAMMLCTTRQGQARVQESGAAGAALPADVVLPPGFYRSELRSRLIAGFHSLPDKHLFFGDVGPTEGCAELDSLSREIAERDAARFRIDYDRALGSLLKLPFVASTPRQFLPLKLRGELRLRIDKSLDHTLIDRGAAEMMKRALRWSAEHRYTGRRRGYDAAGRSFWGTNDATPGLICALPTENRLQFLGAWHH